MDLIKQAMIIDGATEKEAGLSRGAKAGLAALGLAGAGAGGYYAAKDPRVQKTLHGIKDMAESYIQSAMLSRKVKQKAKATQKIKYNKVESPEMDIHVVDPIRETEPFKLPQVTAVGDTSALSTIGGNLKSNIIGIDQMYGNYLFKKKSPIIQKMILASGHQPKTPLESLAMKYDAKKKGITDYAQGKLQNIQGAIKKQYDKATEPIRKAQMDIQKKKVRKADRDVWNTRVPDDETISEFMERTKDRIILPASMR